MDGIWTCGLGGHTYVMGAEVPHCMEVMGWGKKGSCRLALTSPNYLQSEQNSEESKSSTFKPGFPDGYTGTFVKLECGRTSSAVLAIGSQLLGSRHTVCLPPLILSPGPC